jgi:sortase A
VSAREARPLWRTFEALFWIAGLGLLLAYGAARMWSRQQQQEGLEQFAALRATAESVNTAGSPGASATVASPLPADGISSAPDRSAALATPVPDRALWSPQRIRAYEAASATAVLPLGVLRIPSIGLAVPIYEGTDDATLDRGAGRIEGTAQLNEEGNVGIAAHRDGFFRGLKDLSLGDELTLQTWLADRRYRVTRLWITRPTDVSVIAPGTSDALTLVTCYPFYFVGSAPQRFIVRAEPIAP